MDSGGANLPQQAGIFPDKDHFGRIFYNQANAEEVKKMGTHKDWDTYVINSDTGKVCFAQSKPVLQSPKSYSREAIIKVKLDF